MFIDVGGRLKYASPQDLPSFPSIGVKGDHAAASSIAASLGWANHRSFEPWKPDTTISSSAASAAAMLARDRSGSGSKATSAAESAGRKDTRQTAPQSAWGSSAASQAFRTHAAQHSTDVAASDRQWPPRAAKGAVGGPRLRSVSSPQPTREFHPDQISATSNALTAATTAHRPSIRPPVDDTGAVPYTTMDRQMFTANPPVKPEVDEQNRADVIHASAVAMAKRMYNQQQRTTNAAKQPGSVATSEAGTEPAPYVSLQEAAYKLAQDRLAKLREEHQRNREYHEYYGSSAIPPRRFGLRGKLRRRSFSDGDVMEDRMRSQQIRKQTSLFTARLSEVDEQKRQKDRQALLAAAQRNVKAQLQGMDEKVYSETGKVTPALLSEWELKAHAAAQSRSEARRDDNAGKIDIGGGKYMDSKTVNEIAAKRVQPLLDEINAKAEKERERQAALRLEEENRRRELEVQRARDREIKETHEKIKRS